MSVHRKYISKVNQQDASFSRSIYFYKLLYMFQAVPPPIIRSTKLYIQCQVLSNQYCCYRGWDGTSPDDGRRNRLKHVDQFIEINRSRKRCILLVVLWRYTCDARTCERQSHALCILAMRVASSKTWAFSLGGRYQFSAQTDHYGPGFRCYTQTVQVNADTVLHIMLHDCCSHMYSLLQLFITIPSFDSTHTYRH